MRAALFFKYLLPIILWMLLIFGGSTDLGAPKNTSRIIGPLLRWLNPEVSQETIGHVQMVIRKTGHAVEYAILALLVWRAARHWRTTSPPRVWNWRHAALAILTSFLYAASDEFHQTFVASRQGSIWDVLLDTMGATIGILLLWQIGRRFKTW